jgi:DNA-binding SARP family transcriptional activator
LFSLKLFAGASILTPNGPLQGRAVHRHRLALLALLNQAGARGLTRDKLAGLLWPDAESSRARALLSDSVYRVNLALGGEVVGATGEEPASTATATSDVATFESALEGGTGQRRLLFTMDLFWTGSPSRERRVQPVGGWRA